MINDKPIPAETKKALQNFAVAYFFIFRIQIKNAELIHRALNNEIPKNRLLIELGHGYINGAVTEFVLLLYDAADLLKRSTSSYRYKTDGAIEKIFMFRRHILAHRGCNWGSEESKQTLNFFHFSQQRIFQACHEAALEFVVDLRRYMSFEPISDFPSILEFKKPDLENLLRNSSELMFTNPSFTENEVIDFFGTNLRSNLNQ